MALAVRLGYVLWQDPRRWAGSTDYHLYLAQAKHMLTSSSGPEDTFMPPGFSWWIALGRLLHLPSIWLPLWQVAAGVATVALVGIGAGRLTQSNRIGAWAAWGTALYAPFIYYQGFLLTETTTAALMALTIAVAAGGLDRLRDRALAGLALGAAAVWRTNLALVLPLWLLLAVAGQGLRRTMRGPLPAILAWAALPISVAAIRASILVGAVTGPATNGGVNFLLAHSDWTEVRNPYTGSDMPGGTRFCHAARHRHRTADAIYVAPDPVFREGPLYADGLRWIARNPARAAVRLPLACLEGLGLGRDSYFPTVYWYSTWLDADALMDRLRVPLGLLVAVPGLGWAVAHVIRRRSQPGDPASDLVLATIGVAMITFALFLSEPRMRVPFDAAFLIAAVLAWRALWRLRRGA